MYLHMGLHRKGGSYNSTHSSLILLNKKNIRIFTLKKGLLLSAGTSNAQLVGARQRKYLKNIISKMLTISSLKLL